MAEIVWGEKSIRSKKKLYIFVKKLSKSLIMHRCESTKFPNCEKLQTDNFDDSGNSTVNI